jgi:hypothetical protein
MTMSLLLQYGAVALAVSFSAGYVVQKQWPEAVRAVRVRCAVPLLRDGRAPWVRSIGRAVAPMPWGGQSACGGCNACGANE